MKRWPHYMLALTLFGALAVVFGPQPTEPTEWVPFAETEALAEGFPETAVLRTQAKKLLAREVAEGRRSLVEAAALFGALNRLPPVTPELSCLDNSGFHWVLSAPVHTEEERLCRQVVQWVDGFRLSDSPEYAAAAVARLEAEFREELRRQGAIRLPDASGLPTARELLERARATMTETVRKTGFRPRQDAGGR
jgi:hypothetical protein